MVTKPLSERISLNDKTDSFILIAQWFNKDVTELALFFFLEKNRHSYINWIRLKIIIADAVFILWWPESSSLKFLIVPLLGQKKKKKIIIK